MYAVITAAALLAVEAAHEADTFAAHLERMAVKRTDTIQRLMTVWGKEYLLENEHIVNVSEHIFTEFEVEMDLHDPPLIAWDFWGALFYVGTMYTTIGARLCPGQGGQPTHSRLWQHRAQDYARPFDEYGLFAIRHSTRSGDSQRLRCVRTHVHALTHSCSQANCYAIRATTCIDVR